MRTLAASFRIIPDQHSRAAAFRNLGCFVRAVVGHNADVITIN